MQRRGKIFTASSAHAAELLANSGHTVQIVTFGDCEPFAATSLENHDPDDDLFDAEIQIALKKIIKKDSQTREKGLKELRQLIDKVSIDDVRKSFKHFVILFPKLSVDATATIRSNAVRVLGGYIKKLQKNSEPYLKKILPYVILLMQDSYSQVVNESKSMLADCFPNEKYDTVMEIFKEPVCEIALKFMSDKHQLLRKGEGEETEEQRFMRLALQSIQYLHSICTESMSDELRKQIFQFFSGPYHRRLISPSSQMPVVSSMLNLASRITTLTDGWEAILKSYVPTASFTHLDNADRSVSRAAALFVHQMVKAKVLFNVLDIDETVARRMVAVINRKKNFWSNVSNVMVPVIKAVLEEKTIAESQLFLEKILDAFFEGMPWNISFPNVAWVNTFIEFTELRICWTMNQCANDLDSIVDKFFTKVFFHCI
ncbi:unnamed protein product [Onchocerca flexuosa]|uniref:E3 ubiquitin-protein ligase listerin n=1 Tax=Onchocerca flexuosa TaxID=387005 RepID=A0A183HC26_9BILA|nr:unnamed protein product [Onchocerca flexuosa]